MDVVDSPDMTGIFSFNEKEKIMSELEKFRFGSPIVKTADMSASPTLASYTEHIEVRRHPKVGKVFCSYARIR